MKIRNGFVSNSSSSSFIIALDKAIVNKPCDKCGRIDINLIELIERSEGSDWSDQTSIRSRGYNHIVKDVIENYFDGLHKVELLKELENFKVMDWQIFQIQVSYSDKMILNLIETMSKQGSIRILSRND